MYGNGRGVPQDYVQAHKWFNLAASHMPPGDNQENARKGRDLMEENLNPDQVAKAQNLAREWKPKPNKSP